MGVLCLLVLCLLFLCLLFLCPLCLCPLFLCPLFLYPLCLFITLLQVLVMVELNVNFQPMRSHADVTIASLNLDSQEMRINVKLVFVMEHHIFSGPVIVWVVVGLLAAHMKEKLNVEIVYVPN